MVLSHSVAIPFFSFAYKSRSCNLMSQVPPTFIVNLILLKIFPLLLASMASRMVTSYGPQAAQANEKPPSESFLNLTLTQHPRDENSNLERCALVLKLNPLEPGTIVFRQTPTPWWSCYKSTLLPVTNPKLSMKVVMKPKTLPSSLGLQFPVLDIIVGCAVRFVDYLLIARQTT